MTRQRGSVSAQDTREQLIAWLADRFTHLEALKDELVSLLSVDSDGLLSLTATAKRGMKTAAAHYLQEQPVVDGCGLIFAHSALGTDAGHLEWWVREDESRFARYSFGVVPGADRYYDYEQHEWFTKAFHEDRSAAVGPYIDYLGVEVYLITLTIPAIVSGHRVGAVGNDIQIDDLERALLPMLLNCETDCVLISGRDSVLLSNSAEFLPGELISEPKPGYRFLSLSDHADGMHVMVPLEE